FLLSNSRPFFGYSADGAVESRALGHSTGRQFESRGFAVVAQVLADSECSKVAKQFDAFTSDEAGSRALLELDWCRNLALTLRSNAEIAPHLPSDSVAVQCTALS